MAIASTARIAARVLAIIVITAFRAMGTWTAYNDCAWTTNSTWTPPANDTAGNFTTNSPLALLNGPLMTSAGQVLSARVLFNTNSATAVGLLDRNFGPPTGSDADAWFSGHVGTNCAVNWTAGSVTMTVTGLSASARYNIVLWSTRGATGPQYSNRFTDITISGAAVFTNRSSAATELSTIIMPNDRTRVRSSLAAGLVARYDGVHPGADGVVTFTLTAGSDLLWPSGGVSTNAYLNAFLIQKLGGATNAVEFDPLQTTPSWASSNNLLHLVGNSIEGKIYRVMHRSVLTSGNWQIYAAATASVNDISMDVPVNGLAGFYQLVETALAAPMVNNDFGVTALGPSTATLAGVLTFTGGLPTATYVCWDTSDKGTASTSAWSHVETVGVYPTGSFAYALSGLITNVTYYYRCYAMNDVGGAFAPTASSFVATTQTSAFYQIFASYGERYIQSSDDASKRSDEEYGNNANYASTYVFVGYPTPGNHVPVINSVSANPTTVTALGTVNLSVSATDSDGDPLQYFWVAPAGQMGWSRASNETWRAASVGATYTLQVMVGDGKSWTSSYFNVQVSSNGFSHSNANHTVSLTSVRAAKTMVAPGETIDLSFTTFDRDPPTAPGYCSGRWGASGGRINGLVAGYGTNGITWTAPSTINASTNRPTKLGYVLWDRFPSDMATCPIPPSTGLVAIGIVGRVSHAHSADTFMPCWAADGSMYTAWQDGYLYSEPFVFTNLHAQGWGASGYPIHSAWAKILGDDPMDISVVDAGLIPSYKDGWAGRYPNAVFHKNGVLYFGTRLSDNGGTFYPAGPNVGFHYRPDGGAWTISPYDHTSYLFGTNDPPMGSNKVTRYGQTYLVDYGQNQTHSPDGKVYFVSAGTPIANGNTAHEVADDAVYLCRVNVTTGTVNNASAYEFYAGSNTWSSSLASAQPLLTWSNHISSAAITYVPGMNKYIMSCERARFYWGAGPSNAYDELMLTDFDFFFLESSSLTGPYSLVQYCTGFGKQGYYPNIPSKFLSADGKRAWLWYGANFEPREQFSDPASEGYNFQDPFGGGYRMVEQEIRFLTPDELVGTP